MTRAAWQGSWSARVRGGRVAVRAHAAHMSGQLSNFIILSRLEKLNALVQGKGAGQDLNCAGQPDWLPFPRPPRRVCRQLGKSEVEELIAEPVSWVFTQRLRTKSPFPNPPIGGDWKQEEGSP